MATRKRTPKKQPPKPTQPCCGNCKYGHAFDKGDPENMSCRRYPPTVSEEGSMYPPVHPLMFCGEHRFGDSLHPLNS